MEKGNEKLFVDVLNKLVYFEVSDLVNKNNITNVNKFFSEQKIKNLFMKVYKKFIPIDDYSKNRAKNIMYNSEKNKIYKIINDIFCDFSMNKISYVLLKGIDLAYALYDENYSIRDYDDIDILVDERDFLKACKILEKYNFQEYDLENNENSELLYEAKSSLECKFVNKNISKNFFIELKKYYNNMNSLATKRILQNSIDKCIKTPTLNFNYKGQDFTDMFITLLSTLYHNYFNEYYEICEYDLKYVFEIALFLKKYINEIDFNKVIDFFTDMHKIRYEDVRAVMELFFPNYLPSKLNIIPSFGTNNKNPKWKLSEIEWFLNKEYRILKQHSIAREKSRLFLNQNNPLKINIINEKELSFIEAKYLINSEKKTERIKYDIYHDSNFIYFIFDNFNVLKNMILEINIFDYNELSLNLNSFIKLKCKNNEVSLVDSLVPLYIHVYNNSKMVIKIDKKYCKLQEIDDLVYFNFSIIINEAKIHNYYTLYGGEGWYTLPITVLLERGDYENSITS